MAMLLLAVSLTIGISSCDNGSTVQSTKTGKQEISQPVQEPAPNPITKWEFTDYLGQKYTLKLNNDDGTAQLNYNGITKYGSFEKSQWGYDLLALIFDANDLRVRYETPGSPFGNGGSLLYRAQLDIKNGYLYEDGHAYEAKDPTRRLKVTKR